MIREHLAKLKRRFSNSPNIIQTRTGTARLPFRSQHAHWIVARGLCFYRCQDFSNVPKNRRKSALKSQVSVWSGFENPDHYPVWSGSLAMVWYWDAEKVSVSDGELPDSASHPKVTRFRIRPESVFLGRKHDGARLLRCQEGFEVQYWQNNVLKDSFWYPEQPAQHQLKEFLNRQGVTNNTDDLTISLALEPVMNAEPWGSELTPREWLEVNEWRLVASCVLVLSMIMVWQEVRFWKMDQLKETVAQEFTRKQDQLEPLLQARNELLNLRQKNQRLSDILSKPSQAYLMSIVDRATPSKTARFQEWHYQQGELRVIVEDADLSPIDYVRALEAQPLFSRVKVEQARGKNSIEITLTVGA